MPRTNPSRLPAKKIEAAGPKENSPAEQRRLDDALIETVMAGDARSCAKMLAQGASPRAEPSEDLRPTNFSGDSHTALTLALDRWKSGEAALVLLAAGADPNAQRGGTWSCLTLSMHRHPGCVDALLDAGARPFARGGQPWDCPMLAAVSHGRVESFARMARMGGDPAPRDDEGNGAATVAAGRGQLAMLAHLLARGDWEDFCQESPAHKVQYSGAPKSWDALACAARPESWEGPGMASVGARLVEAARELRGADHSTKATEPDYAGLFQAAERSGFYLALESAKAFESHAYAMGGPRLEARTQWMSMLLEKHPKWGFAPEEARRLAEDLRARAEAASRPKTKSKAIDGQAWISSLERRILQREVGELPRAAAAPTLRI